MKHSTSRKRGIALLFVLGMLTLLLTLALAFVTVVQLDYKGSLAGTSSVKADMVIDVAIKRAIQQIEASPSPFNFENYSGMLLAIQNPKANNTAGTGGPFFFDNGVHKNQYIVSTGGTALSAAERRQLFGTYNTGIQDIDDIATGGLNDFMRGPVTSSSQIPTWVQLGYTDAEYCYMATDLSGFANQEVYVDETASPPTTNVLPVAGRPARAFGSSYAEINIPHHPNHYTKAHFPLGAYWPDGWGALLGNADADALGVDRPNTPNILPPINLQEVNASVTAGGTISPALTNRIDAAFRNMGKEYGRPRSPLRASEVVLALRALKDYIDVDVDPVGGTETMQTEAHPAINEFGNAIKLEKLEQMGTPTNPTNVWTVRVYSMLETHYSYVDPDTLSGTYQVNWQSGYDLDLDNGAEVQNQPIALASVPGVQYIDMMYRLHDTIGTPGAPYIELAYTNNTASLDVTFISNFKDPQIYLGSAAAGPIVDEIYTSPGVPGATISVTNAVSFTDADEGNIKTLTLETTDPRFNWDRAIHWAGNRTAGSLGTQFYASPPVLVGERNLSNKNAGKSVANDRDSATYVRNGPLKTVGELAYLPYAPMQTITVNRRTAPAGLPPSLVTAFRNSERFHPIWNYFSMDDPDTPQKYYINPNGHHFTQPRPSTNWPQLRTTPVRITQYVFEDMKIGPYPEEPFALQIPGTYTLGAAITTAQAKQMADLMASLGHMTQGAASPGIAAQFSETPGPDRGYFANMSDYAFHQNLASVVYPSIETTQDTTVRSPTDPTPVTENEVEAFTINSFDLMHTRNNVFAFNILIKTTHGIRQETVEVWRDPFPPAGGSWHDTFMLSREEVGIID